MQLDTINTLYLELSQIATATTAKEIALRKQLEEWQSEHGITAAAESLRREDIAELQSRMMKAEENATRLESAIRSIADEATHYGEHNSYSGKTLLPLGYQAIIKLAESALANDAHQPTRRTNAS